MTTNKTMTGHQPAGTEMAVTKPLRLDIQFFADENKSGDGAGDNPGDGAGTGDNKNPADPPGGKGEGDGDGDDDELPMNLKQLMADYPEIRSQVKAERAAAAERAVKKRFRNQDDPNKKQDKPGEGEGDGDGDGGEELKTWQTKASKLEARVKESAVAAYAAGEGFNAKLVAALAAGRIDQLQLDDDGKVDKEDLEEIMDELAEEFPDVFKKDTQDQQDTNQATGTKQRKRFSPGATNQNTNERKQQESNAAAVVREQYERMQKKKLI